MIKKALNMNGERYDLWTEKRYDIRRQQQHLTENYKNEELFMPKNGRQSSEQSSDH